MLNKENLRIIFMGTPEFAVASLKSLVEGGYNVVAVVTQPDKPVGRHGSVLRAPAVKEYAINHGLPVLQPEKMKDPDFQKALASYEADLQVVVAFRMLPEAVWAMPQYGTFNVHAALLPQYRGAAPINWAIINGERQTGVTTFFLDHTIDTGRIIMQRTFDIPDDADVEYVYNGLMALGAEICIDTVDAIIAGNGQVDSIPQPTFSDLRTAPKLFKENCQIDFSKPAKQVYDFIRGLCPVPGAWGIVNTDVLGDNTIKIYRTKKTGLPCQEAPGNIRIETKKILIATQDEWLEICSLQIPGKKRMEAKDILNGIKGSNR